MRDFLCQYLVCPVCHSDLSWDIATKGYRGGDDIIEAVAKCAACGAKYEVKDGIGAFLTPDLVRDDLWEELDSGISAYLKKNPDKEAALLESPLLDLKPADRLIRGFVLSERRDYEGADKAFAASDGVYTPEYSQAQKSQIAYLVNRVASTSGPVVDLASGKAALAQPLTRRDPLRPLVVTDFSPTVLRSDKAYFEYLGISESMEFMAFDARRMPFRDGSVPTLTSNVGLQNMRDVKGAIREISRVLGGTMIATSLFYPPGDPDTDEILEASGMDVANYRDKFSQECEAAGLRLSIENVIHARALPTPKSEITGASLDALPIKEMILDWCTAVLTPKT